MLDATACEREREIEGGPGGGGGGGEGLAEEKIWGAGGVGLEGPGRVSHPQSMHADFAVEDVWTTTGRLIEPLLDQARQEWFIEHECHQ